MPIMEFETGSDICDYLRKIIRGDSLAPLQDIFEPEDLNFNAE